MPSALLLYARFHGLASDHRSGRISNYLDDIEQIEVTDPNQDADLEKLRNYPSLSEPKPLLSQNSYVHLLNCMRVTSPPASEGFLPDHKRISKMKLRTPLLRTDHDLDVVELKADLKKTTVELEDLTCYLDEEEYLEALKWPEEYINAADKYHEMISNEGLCTTREVVAYLQDCFTDKSSKDKLGEFDAQDVTHPKVVDLEQRKKILIARRNTSLSTYQCLLRALKTTTIP